MLSATNHIGPESKILRCAQDDSVLSFLPVAILPIRPPRAANGGRTAAATSQKPRKSTGTISGGNAITLFINVL